MSDVPISPAPRRSRVVGWVTAGALVAAGAAGTVWAFAVHRDGTATTDEHAAHDDVTMPTTENGETVMHGMTVHDATGGREATAEDEVGAAAYYEAVRAAASKYADIEVAMAEGFAAGPAAGGELGGVGEIHLRNVANEQDDLVMDYDRPEALVYLVDGDEAVLLGVMFIAQPDQEMPQPGGPLTVWHDHGQATCPDDNPICHPDADPPAFIHVWVFDQAVDPFAMGFPEAVGTGDRPLLVAGETITFTA